MPIYYHSPDSVNMLPIDTRSPSSSHSSVQHPTIHLEEGQDFQSPQTPASQLRYHDQYIFSSTTHRRSVHQEYNDATLLTIQQQLYTSPTTTQHPNDAEELLAVHASEYSMIQHQQHNTSNPYYPSTLNPLFMQHFFNTLNFPEDLDPNERMVQIYHRFRAMRQEARRTVYNRSIETTYDDIELDEISVPDFERDAQQDIQRLVDDYYDHLESSSEWWSSRFALDIASEDESSLDSSRPARYYDCSSYCSSISEDNATTMTSQHVQERDEWQQYIQDLITSFNPTEEDLFDMALQEVPIFINDISQFQACQQQSVPNLVYNSQLPLEDIAASYYHLSNNDISLLYDDPMLLQATNENVSGPYDEHHNDSTIGYQQWVCSELLPNTNEQDNYISTIGSNSINHAQECNNSTSSTPDPAARPSSCVDRSANNAIQDHQSTQRRIP